MYKHTLVYYEYFDCHPFEIHLEYQLGDNIGNAATKVGQCRAAKSASFCLCPVHVHTYPTAPPPKERPSGLQVPNPIKNAIL